MKKIMSIENFCAETLNVEVNVPKEVKRLCKECAFSAGVLRGSLAERRGER